MDLGFVMDTGGAKERNAGILYYCDKCNRLIKPVSDGGIKDGEKRFCVACAGALPAPRGSQRNIKPAAPSAPTLKAASRDSRRLPVVTPAEFPSHVERSRPKPHLVVVGIGLVLFLALTLGWMLSAGAPGDRPVSSAPPETHVESDVREAPPVVPALQTPPPVPETTNPVRPSRETELLPLAPVTTHFPLPTGGQPAAPAPSDRKPAVPAGGSPEERLAAFRKGLQSVEDLVVRERYRAAGELLHKLQDESSSLPWWKEQEPKLDEARQRLQQLVQEVRENAEAACAEAEKATTPAALEALERQWRPVRAAAPAGEVSAEGAQKVLDTIAARRRGQRERLVEQAAAQLNEKLGPFEKSVQNASRLAEAQQKTLAELEGLALQDGTLIDRYGERLAALRWLANASQDEELSIYGGHLRKIGAAFEVGFDFSSREQLAVWELDDPDKHGRWDLLPGQGLRLESTRHHEWWGKDRKNTPVLRVPFWFRADRWAAEVDVELVSRSGDKTYGGALTIWEGGQNHLSAMLEETGKGWSAVLWGCTPNREAAFAKASTALPGKAGESVRLQMACTGDTVTATARFRGATVAIGKERLGFQPRYLGLMVRTNGDITAVAHFRDLKIAGLPDGERLKVQHEHRKPAEVKRLFEDLRLRGRLTERIASGTSFPVPLGDAANVACSNRLRENRSDDERLILPRWGLLAVGGIPFQVLDPQSGNVKNAILLKGEGAVPSRMPERAVLPCGRAAGSLHLLSGVSVGGFPGGEKGSHTLTLRIQYADGQAEEHLFRNGMHFADYARPIDVPLSMAAFRHQGRQVRYFCVKPKRSEAVIRELEFVKGEDGCAPLILAVTLDARLPLPGLYNPGFKDQPVAPGRLGKALDCDGSRTFKLDHRDELEPEEFTLEAWLKMEEYPDERRWMVSKNGNETRRGHYGLLIDRERVMAYVHGDRTYEIRGGRLDLNRWEHIAATFSRDRLLLYQNGEQVAECGLAQPRPKDDGVFAIGVRPDNFKPFKGLIDEVRIFNRVVPPDEMRLHAGDPETAPRNGLIAYWSFDEE